MRDDSIHEETYRGRKIEIVSDGDPQNPIVDCSPFAAFACFHRRYQLGNCFKGANKRMYDDTFPQFDTPEELAEYLKAEKPPLVFPLYLYDHSGLRIKIGSFNGLLPQGHAEFDSGKVGYVFMTREMILKNYGGKKLTKKLLERATKTIENEVECYDDYLSGNVWGYTITNPDGSEGDSCYGYIGDYDGEYGALSEARSAVDAEIKHKLKEHCKKLKTWIQNKVAMEHRCACPSW